MKRTISFVKNPNTWNRKERGDIWFCREGVTRAYPKSNSPEVRTLSLTISDKAFAEANLVEVYFCSVTGGYNVQLVNGDSFMLASGTGFLRHHFGRVLGKFWIKFEAE